MSHTFLFITNYHNRPHRNEDLEKKLCAVMLRDPKKCPDWANYSGQVYQHHDLLGNARYESLSRHDERNWQALSELLSSPHTYYILSRRNVYDDSDPPGDFTNSFTAVQFIDRAVRNVSRILKESGANRICFTSTPHDFESWIFFHVAAAYSYSIYTIRESALPWRALVAKIRPHRYYGFVSEQFVSVSQEDIFQSEIEKTRKYIERQRGSYKTAEPRYLIEAKRRKLRRTVSGLRSVRPKGMKVTIGGIFSYLKRRHLNRELERKLSAVCHAELPDRPYVAFFMHYQPERTSVPDGGAYGHQFLAIRRLLEVMPKAWHLLIKEHPATFLFDSRSPFRHPAFYDELSRHPQIKFSSALVESFQVIDHANAVCTLTGRVGMEALSRGVPVIVMGDAAYRDAPGVVDLSEQDVKPRQLQNEIEGARKKLGGPELLKYLTAVIGQTVYVPTDHKNPDGKKEGEKPGETLNRETMTAAVLMASKQGVNVESYQ